MQRTGYSARLTALLRTFPAVAILGPRQAGKSSLALEYASPQRATRKVGRGDVVLFDLERGSDLNRLQVAAEEDLGLVQETARLICIDEVQRLPSLFTLLRALLDDRKRKARYILLGSASPDVVRGVSETLAGRIGFLDLSPFLLAELGEADARKRERHWLRGGFPRSYLARSESASVDWRESYVRTFLERDMPALGLGLSPPLLRRLWTMLAHVHGGILNASEIAAGLAVSVPTVQRYIDALIGTFMVRRLQPYWANVGKRLVKAPKIYLRDSGILHTLLGIGNGRELRAHPKSGSSWEGWVVEQLIGAFTLVGDAVEPFFWRTHGGAEVDLLLSVRGQLLPIEVKLGTQPTVSRGLVECMKDLKVERGFVLHGGDATYPLSASVQALPITMLADPKALMKALFGRPRFASASGSRPS